MTVSKQDHASFIAEALIRQHEGVSALPYEDSVGKITIGIGRNLTDRGLSVDEVEMLFANDMKIAAEILDIWCHDWRDFSATRQAALLSMAFNLGAPRLSQFIKLRAALAVRDFTTASAEALDSKWAKQVGHRAQHIADLLAKG